MSSNNYQKSYQLIVFDWEGTLSDTIGQVLNILAIQAVHLGLGELNVGLARQYARLGLSKAIVKLFPGISDMLREQLILAVQTSLVTQSSEVTLFEGAKSWLNLLKSHNIKLAIATNKGQSSFQRALQSSALGGMFDVTRCAGNLAPKPNSEMLQNIMDCLGVDASQTVMIGDSISDIEMASALNVDAIGVDFYHQNSEDLRLKGAIAVFNDYKTLSSYVNQRLYIPRN